jgi:hypothetical protein
MYESLPVLFKPELKSNQERYTFWKFWYTVRASQFLPSPRPSPLLTAKEGLSITSELMDSPTTTTVALHFLQYLAASH